MPRVYSTREVRVTRIGPSSVKSSFQTWEQTVHGEQALSVPPGEYEVTVEDFSRKVTVGAGQSQEVSFGIGP